MRVSTQLDVIGIPTYLDLGRQAASAKYLSAKWQANPEGVNVGASTTGLNPSSIFENADSYTYGATDGGVYVEFLTGDSTDDDCYIGTTAFYFEFQGLSNYYSIHRFSLPVITYVRFFVGLGPYGYANTGPMIAADDPSKNMVGIQFSTTRDTNFQFVRSDSSSQSLTDTGVAPATDVIYQLEQEFSSNGTSLRGRLTNVETGSVLWADTTVTDNLPAATTALAPFIGAKTKADADAKFRFYKVEVWV